VPGGSRRRPRLYLPHGVVLAFQLISFFGFVAATVVSIIFGLWSAVAIFVLLSILHASLSLYLLKIGKQGWKRTYNRS
jgi:hypothetical protein